MAVGCRACGGQILANWLPKLVTRDPCYAKVEFPSSWFAWVIRVILWVEELVAVQCGSFSLEKRVRSRRFSAAYAKVWKSVRLGESRKRKDPEKPKSNSHRLVGVFEAARIPLFRGLKGIQKETPC